MRVRLPMLTLTLMVATAAAAQDVAPSPDVPIAWLRTPSAVDVEAVLRPPRAEFATRPRWFWPAACRSTATSRLPAAIGRTGGPWARRGRAPAGPKVHGLCAVHGA